MSVDFDLHGLVRIRLDGAGDGDIEAVARQLGIRPSASTSAEADLRLRFVTQLPDDRDLRYLGVDDAGFDDDAFLVLRGKHKSRVKVALPLGTVGQRSEIVCQHGLPAVPLLVATINVTLVTRGILPLHAAALSFEGRGVLMTGWSKGGKTETLLSFMEHGATFVGDEWVYLDPAAGRMWGVPEPIRLWRWHLDDLPWARARLSTGRRLKLAALGHVGRGLDLASRRYSGRRRSLVRYGRNVVDGQQFVDVPPQALFGADRCGLSAPLDVVFLVMSTGAPGIRVRPVEPHEVARRMVHSLQYERADLLAAYRQFRFAFPGSPNPVLEDLEARELALLETALDGRPAYVVEHPYPVKIQDLQRAMAPYVRASGPERPS